MEDQRTVKILPECQDVAAMRGKKRGKAETGSRAPCLPLRTGVKVGKVKIELGASW